MKKLLVSFSFLISLFFTSLNVLQTTASAPANSPTW